MRRNLQAIVLGAFLMASPLIVPPQIQAQTEISVEIKKGMTKEDALKSIDFLKFRISNISTLEEYDALVNYLSKLIEYGPNREIQYKSHFLMASLTYQRSLGWGKKYFDESFSHLETDVIQYSDQEKKFGLAADALAKISERLTQQKIFALITNTRIFELYNMSSYPKAKEESSKVKDNLDQILNTPIGGLTLTQALQKMFSPDGMDFDVSLDLREYVYDGTAIFPVPEQYVWNGPETNFKELRIQPHAALPALIFKNSSPYFSPPELGEQVDVTEEVKQEAQRQGRINTDALSDAVCIQLDKRGISTDLSDLQDYFTGYMGKKKVIGLVYPIFVNSGISIKDLLTSGGINPYNWIYKGSNSAGSLKDLKW